MAITSSHSLSAWKVKRYAAVSFLKVQVLNVVLSRAITLVLEKSVNRLLDLISKHAFGINALFIIGLAIVVNFSPHNVIPYKAAFLVARVQEGQVTLIV